jgi:hypothetical protein
MDIGENIIKASFVNRFDNRQNRSRLCFKRRDEEIGAKKGLRIYANSC